MKISKQTLNLAAYKIDDLEQYERQENISIHCINESESIEDDGK